MIDMVPKAIMLNLVQYVEPINLTGGAETVLTRDRLQVYQGRDAEGAPGEHVSPDGARRPAEGERLHDPAEKGVPGNGGGSVHGQ